MVTADNARAEQWRASRPRDTVENPHMAEEFGAAVGRSRRASGELHVLVIVAEGQALDAVLAGGRLAALAPWVVVVTGSPAAAGADVDGHLSDAGFELALFDGVSRFYRSGTHPELAPTLSYPACSLDEFTDAQVHELQVQNSGLQRAVDEAREANLSEMLRWRHAAVSAWAATATARPVAASNEELMSLRAALAAAQQDAVAVRQTLSWRVTTPLRAVRSVGRRP